MRRSLLYGNVIVDSSNSTALGGTLTISNSCKTSSLNNQASIAFAVADISYGVLKKGLFMNGVDSADARITAIIDTVSPTVGTALSVSVSPNTTNPPVEALRVQSNGNVGIGTQTPAYSLDVNGNIRVGSGITGNIRFGSSGVGTTQAGYIDLINNNMTILNQQNGNIIIGTNNAEDMRISQTGNVGIGTQNPAYPLDVNGNIRLGSETTGNIRFGSSGVGTTQAGYIDLINNNMTIMNQQNGYLALGTNNSEDMRILSNGLVGIGTVNPASTLDVNGNITSNTNITHYVNNSLPSITNSLTSLDSISCLNLHNNKDMTASNQRNIYINMAGQGGLNIAWNVFANFALGPTISTNQGSSLDINLGWANGTGGYSLFTAMSISAISSTRAYVGIGTVNPASTLDVSNEIAIKNTDVVRYSQTSTLGFGFGGGSVGTKYRWKIDDITLNRDNGAGPNYDYGVQSKLIFSAKSNNTYNSTANDTAYIQGLTLVPNSAGNGAVSTAINVGIGTINPTFQLELSTNSAAKPTSGSWTTTSDIRIKENITDADLDICYSICKNLKLRRFTWKDYIGYEDDRNVVGYIAQEVQEIFPKSVYVNKKTMLKKKGETGEIIEEEIEDFLSLDVDQINKTLHGAVQKLMKITEEQQTIISNLEARLSALENK